MYVSIFYHNMDREKDVFVCIFYVFTYSIKHLLKFRTWNSLSFVMYIKAPQRERDEEKLNI